MTEAQKQIHMQLSHNILGHSFYNTVIHDKTQNFHSDIEIKVQTAIKFSILTNSTPHVKRPK